MKLANVMRNLYQNTYTDTTGTAMIDLNPEIDIKLITNNQNQNRISSFLTVLWSSILDNAMWKNSSYIIYYILEFFFYCP